MRFDSMIATALSSETDSVAARTSQWRQLLDVLAQGEHLISNDLCLAAFTRLAALRADVPLAERQRAAAQLAGRVRSVGVSMLFANDDPRVAMPVLRALTLDDDAWCVLITRISPVSRALLRNRRDLPERARMALASYGASDFGLPGAVLAAEPESTQIRALVERIEAFRSTTGDAARLTQDAAVAESFAFQCSAEGRIDWIAGTPREPLIGMALGDAADAGGYGVDGQAAGAFKRRAPFRDARLMVAGSGAAAGQWLISGSPVFNPRDGRFAGYHGTARRPRPGEIAGPVARFGGTTIPVDSMRQLIHELRTPLNAVLGFAAMIDQQLLGPAARAYRERAHAIVDDGQRLLDMVDDLAHAARPVAAVPVDDAIDVRAIVAQTVLSLNLEQNVTIEPGFPVPVAVDARAIERMIARLVVPMAALTHDAETVQIAVGDVNGRPRIAVRRVAALANDTEATLFERNGEHDVAPTSGRTVGLGFALRLVQNMARSAGGRLVVERDAFVITFPGAAILDSLPAGMPRE